MLHVTLRSIQLPAQNPSHRLVTPSSPTAPPIPGTSVPGSTPPGLLIAPPPPAMKPHHSAIPSPRWRIATTGTRARAETLGACERTGYRLRTRKASERPVPRKVSAKRRIGTGIRLSHCERGEGD